MTGLDAIASALVLSALGLSRFARPVVVTGAAAIVLLILCSPVPRETAVTVAIEMPIVWYGFRTGPLPGFALIVICGLVNTLTQPLFATMLRQTAPDFWWRAFLAGEIVVWLAEAGVYFALLPGPRRVSRALVVSLAANVASAGAGLLLPF